MLNKKEKRQYSKQILLNEIGIKGQNLLKKSKVLVVGAGGLGCPVLLQLTTSGVGTIGIIDDDIVALDNLPRQNLFDYNSIDKPKVEQAIYKLTLLNPNTKFISYQKKLSNSNASLIIKMFDLVIDCSDNFLTRYIINDACLVHNKPYIYGAIYKHQGQVAVFNYNGSATYRCLFPKSNTLTPDCNESGVTPSLTNIVGSYQANEALKLIVGYGELTTNKVLVFDALTSKTSFINFKRKNSKSYANINAQYIKNEANYNTTCLNENSVLEINVKEFNKLLKKNIQLIDVREPGEKPLINNLNAINIPISTIIENKDSIDKQKKVILFCNSGKRSKSAIQMLKEKAPDLNNLASLKHGIIKWNEIKDQLKTHNEHGS